MSMDTFSNFISIYVKFNTNLTSLSVILKLTFLTSKKISAR